MIRILTPTNGRSYSVFKWRSINKYLHIYTWLFSNVFEETTRWWRSWPFKIRRVEEVFVIQLQNVQRESVCKLNKALYGLRQSRSGWKCRNRQEPGNSMLLANYACGILIGSNTSEWIQDLNISVCMSFEMKDLDDQLKLAWE